MSRDTVKSGLKNIFRHVSPDIEFDLVDPALPLRDQVDMDSMDFYNILVMIHRQLGVNVPESVLLDLNTVDELVDYIVAHSA